VGGVRTLSTPGQRTGCSLVHHGVGSRGVCCTFVSTTSACRYAHSDLTRGQTMHGPVLCMLPAIAAIDCGATVSGGPQPPQPPPITLLPQTAAASVLPRGKRCR
jgi:hypothetical protein